MVKRGSDADVLHKCLEIKTLTLLTDGESMGSYTGANKAFSTAPCHPVPATLGKIIHSWVFEAVFLISIHLNHL